MNYGHNHITLLSCECLKHDNFAANGQINTFFECLIESIRSFKELNTLKTIDILFEATLNILLKIWFVAKL